MNNLIADNFAVDRDFLIKLCLAVYRVTEVFPAKEPLKFSIREKASQVLADAILVFAKNPDSLTKEEKKRILGQILGNIEILKGYFEVAQAQKWLKEENFLVLAKEYDRIKMEIKKEFFQKEASVGKKKKNSFGTPLDDSENERCHKILEVLSQKEKAQTWEIKKIFPEITKRTLRRNLDHLLEKKLVERVGQGNDTYYKLSRTG